MSFRITERDIQLLAAVARFRFLFSEQLQRIDGGSGRGVRNRLLHLARAGYLMRVQSNVTMSFAYGLANTGARLLAARGFGVNHRLDWSDRNERTQFFLAHTTQIADVLLYFERAAAGVAQLRDHHELMSGSGSVIGIANSGALRVPVSPRHRPLVVPIIPDRLFGLTYPDTTTHHFALELDRGTMDIWANRLVGKSSFRRKLIGYTTAREQRRFADMWGFKSFRVLTVTTSEDRIAHMLDAQRRATPQCPAGFFLYSTLQRLAQHGALGPAWSTSKGGHVSLGHRMTGFSDRKAPAADDSAPSALPPPASSARSVIAPSSRA
jgi:hypothetical protein